jgi:hypothetical protein
MSMQYCSGCVKKITQFVIFTSIAHRLCLVPVLPVVCWRAHVLFTIIVCVWAIHNWKSRKADNLGYTRRNKAKQKHSTMYVGHHYAHTHTIIVNKTCALQQTTGKTGTKHSLCAIDVNITNCVSVVDCPLVFSNV